jgi:hypothetical protein
MMGQAALRITFSVSTPLFLPLADECATPLSKDSFSCGGAHIPRRGKKQWSDIYNPFQQMERRAYAC